MFMFNDYFANFNLTIDYIFTRSLLKFIEFKPRETYLTDNQ